MRETYSVKTKTGWLQLDTPAQKMLDKVKLALRITTDAFDSELRDLIQAAELDLSTVGVQLRQTSEITLHRVIETRADPLITRAVITYCKLHFGEPDKMEMYDRLKASYDEQKAQLSMASEYTEWR